MQTATIEQAFADLCAKHNLTALSVGITPALSPTHRFCAYAHFGPGRCTQATGETAHLAITFAIERANLERLTATIVPALTLEAEAA
jgi:hypothetical protein